MIDDINESDSEYHAEKEYLDGGLADDEARGLEETRKELALALQRLEEGEVQNPKAK